MKKTFPHDAHPTKSQEERRSLLPFLRRAIYALRRSSLGISLAFLILSLPHACAQPFTERNPAQDFNTLGVAGGNKGPQGIFGVDGIMLVSDVNGRIYSYDLASKERQDSPHNDRADNSLTGGNNADDFILFKSGNSGPTIRPFGIWANETNLWVVHRPPNPDHDTDVHRQIKIYAYTITNNVSDVRDDLSGDERYWTGVRDPDRDIESLFAAGNVRPTGIWSDGTTMWVADNNGRNSRLFAYNMWTNSLAEGRMFDFDGSRDRQKDIELSVGTGTGRQEAYDYSRDKNSSPQGIWSDGVTMWVAEVAGATDSAEKRIYAYNLADGSRVPSKDYKTLNENWNEEGDTGRESPDNDRPRGIWSNGEMMWVADQTDNKLYAYHAFRDTTERNPNEDFETLINAGNHRATGIWSNRTNLWVADIVADKLYAYDLVTKDRVPSEDFNTLSTAYTNSIGVTVINNNNNPTGLWSDGTTMWVVDRHLRKVFAYKMSDKSYDESKEITTLASANDKPHGLWANGTTMWVSDRDSDVLHAYNMWTNGVWDGSADSGKNINVGALVGGGEDLYIWDIWSDGTTLWALEFGGWNGNVPNATGHKIYAFTLPHGERAAARDEAKDYDTLDAAGNHIPHGLWSDGETMWVSDDGENKIYAYNALKVEARLGSLTLTGHVPSPGYEDFEVDLIPSFNRGTTNYNASVPYAAERLTVLPKPLRPHDRVFSYSPADPDLSDGYQVSLDVGNNPIFITVTNGNTNLTNLPRTRTYTIDVEREFFTFNDPGKDIALASAHANPRGLWANETIIYVANIGDTNKLYAYNKADGTRFSELVVEVVGQTATTNTVYSKDITLNSANANPRGIWSDGTTIWVADAVFTNAEGKKKLFAYKMSDGTPNADKDIDLAKTTKDEPSEEELKDNDVALIWQTELKNNDNSDPEWIWSDGSIMWVSDSKDKKIYAYNMSDKTRNKSREIELAAISEANDSPQGLWSDGENLWVANGTAGNVKLYAYKLAGEVIDCRDETKDFNTLETAGNLQPKGIFSDGATMYVVGDTTLTNVANGSTNVYKKIYAYNQPLSDNASLRRVELSDVYYENKTFNDYFQTERRLDFYPHAYVLYSTSATTTVSNIETQDPRVNREKQGDDLLGWKIQSPADADSDTAGHQVHLTPGGTTEITIIVTAQSGASREHIIRIVNDHAGPLPFRDFDYSGGSSLPTGLWGDGTTMWIPGGSILYAFKMDANDWGVVDTEKEHKLANRNQFIRGLWGDETTIWAANVNSFPANPYFFNTTKVYGYYRTTDSEGNLNRNSAKDFSFVAANSKPAGLWSDGTTMYVGDKNTINNQWKIFAYNLDSNPPAPDPTKDITIGSLGENYKLLDFWSNKTNFWVLLNNDVNQTAKSSFLNEDLKLYAYEWGTTNQNGNAVRDSSRDIPLRRGVSSTDYLKGAMAIFSHGGIMYVSNRELWQENIGIPGTPQHLTHYRDFKVYAYGLPTSLPESASDPSAQSGLPENLILKGLSLSGISLNPAFSPDTLYYTASVEFDVASTTVTATPNDSEAAVSIFWGPPGSISETSGQGPQVSLQEGDNGIVIEVTAGDGFSRLIYGVGVTRLESPPVSGGPLPLSFQPSSATATAGKSRLIAADALPNGDIRFVFHAPNVEVEVESSLDLTAGSWTPLPKSQFQILRQTGHGQAILTLILPKADENQRFLRLIPRRK